MHSNSKSVDKQPDQDDYKSNQTTSNSMSFIMWPNYPGSPFGGLENTISYDFATNNDVIIAYNYQNIDKDWFLWSLNIKNLSPTQFLWFPTNNHPQEKDFMENEYFFRQIAMIIKQNLIKNPSLQINIRPFKASPTTQDLVNKIKSTISENNVNINKENVIRFGSDHEWLKVFGNKACLHRFISRSDKLSAFEECKVFDDVHGLSECKGYIATNKDEVLMAYDKLIQETKSDQVVIKDCYGFAGKGISFYKSRKEIIDNFVWDDKFKYIAVEENLRFNDDEVDYVEWVGISFLENKILGGGHEQIIVDECGFDGSHTYKNKKIEDILKKVATKVVSKIGKDQFYMGGFDFAIQHFKNKKIEPKIYLIDMNTGRYTGTSATFVLMDKFGITDKYFITKHVKIQGSATFKEIVEEHSDILFDKESKVGVYFDMFLPTKNFSLVSIFGNDEEDANERLNKLQSIKTVCL